MQPGLAPVPSPPLHESWVTSLLESRPPHCALGSVDHVVQLSSSEAATQGSLETPLPLKDFIVSKWKIFLQCKIHMTLQSVQPVESFKLIKLSLAMVTL